MALWAVIGVLGVAAQGAISFFRKPNWASKSPGLDANWKRLAIYSTIAGVLFILADLALVITNNFHSFTLVYVGVVGFVFFQSLITDLSLRYVDRWIMRVANLITLAMSVFLMYTYGTETETVIFAVFAIVATAILFLPGVGDSDGRAFQLMIFTLFPLYGIDGIKYGLLGMLAAIIIYYLAKSILSKEWALNKLFTKMSFPMVPLIVGPVLLVLIFGRWIPTL